MTVWFHVDVNSAFLSWSALKALNGGGTLDLRTVPAAVGGDEEKRHGVVLAKSQPAKRYGVRTGESLFAARQKCPWNGIPHQGQHRHCGGAYGGQVLYPYGKQVFRLHAEGGQQQYSAQGDGQNGVKDLPCPGKGGQLAPGHPEGHCQQHNNIKENRPVWVAGDEKPLAAHAHGDAELEQPPQQAKGQGNLPPDFPQHQRAGLGQAGA